MPNNDFVENLIRLFRLRHCGDTIVNSVMGRELEVIDINKISVLFNEIEDILENKCTIFYSNEEDKEVAELAISIDLRRNLRFEDEVKQKEILDNDNQIRYEVGEEITDYYIVWLYKKVFEKYPIGSKSVMSQRINRVLKNRSNQRIRREVDDDIKVISLLDIMRKAIYCSSLRVSKQKESKVNLEDAIDSYSYTYMCNMNSPIKIYSIEEIIGILNRREKVKNNEFEAPKRKYNSNLIDYYNLAISSDEPFVSFISYYHIIEYFYDEVYREQQINTLRTSITSPRFSYQDDEQLFNIIGKVLKDNRMVRENGSGNEQQSLNYVLNKFIDLDDFKQRLNQEELDFYQENNVSFSKGDAIVWNKDKDKVLKAISNRIYKTRNSLIHSKSSKKDVTYHPYLHKTKLENEISLIKTIAECIIENNSTYLV